MNGKGYATVALIKRKLNCLHEYQTSRFQISNIKRKKKKKIYKDKVSIHLVILNIYAQNNRASKSIKQKLTLNREIKKIQNYSKILISYYILMHSILERIIKPNISKNIKYLNIINQLD